MALDINEYKEKVNAMLAGLPQAVQQINVGLSATAIGFIEDRIVNEGVDGLGKKLGTYSTNPLPTFFFLHKTTGDGADSKLKKLIKTKQKQEKENFKGISYKEFRELNNLPTNFVTLSFTGDTLSDLGVKENVINNAIIVTTVGALGQKTKTTYKANGDKDKTLTTEQILNYLAERYGDNLLALTDGEQEQLALAYDAELQKYINKFLA